MMGFKYDTRCQEISGIIRYKKGSGRWVSHKQRKERDRTLAQDFNGVIIEESLAQKDVLQKLSILQTQVAAVTERHQTPWIQQWTLHTVTIPASQVLEIADELSKSLDPEHAWYADFNNGEGYFVIFRNAIFTWRKGDQDAVERAKGYGRQLGIPDYQLDFPV